MKALSAFFSLVLIVSIVALYISPEVWWGLSFLAVLAPVLWIANFLLLFYWILRPSWWIATTVVALLFGLPLVSDTVAFSGDTTAEAGSHQVLNYNVSHFGKPKGYNQVRDSTKLNNIQQTRSFINWVVQHPAPVKCFQEFYTFTDNPVFDVDTKLKQAGWKYSFISADTLRVNKSRFGVAIYSQYPMLDKGVIFIGAERFNRGIWADVLIGEDTVRIVNVHFASAQLQRAKMKGKGTKSTSFLFK